MGIAVLKFPLKLQGIGAGLLFQGCQNASSDFFVCFLMEIQVFLFVCLFLTK